MKHHTKTLLEELSLIAKKDSTDVILNRSLNVLQAAINVMNQLHKVCDQETALEIERRFINSLRTRDLDKYSRGLKKVKEK